MKFCQCSKRIDEIINENGFTEIEKDSVLYCLWCKKPLE